MVRGYWPEARLATEYYCCSHSLWNTVHHCLDCRIERQAFTLYPQLNKFSFPHFLLFVPSGVPDQGCPYSRQVFSLQFTCADKPKTYPELCLSTVSLKPIRWKMKINHCKNSVCQLTRRPTWGLGSLGLGLPTKQKELSEQSSNIRHQNVNVI